MSKKKGRPMKTQLGTQFGQSAGDGRKTTGKERGEDDEEEEKEKKETEKEKEKQKEEKKVRVTGGGGTANPEPIELFIDWNRDRHDEVMELMSW
jgi:hypothetical protein